MRVRFFFVLASLCLSGCASFQDYKYNIVQCYRADAAWRECYGTLGSGMSKDYQAGWKKGFADLASGACDEPPPVPPKKYWAASYQSEAGRCCVDQWYSGWQDGASAAISTGYPHFHRIPVSPTVPQGPVAGHVFHAGGEAGVAATQNLPETGTATARLSQPQPLPLTEPMIQQQSLVAPVEEVALPVPVTVEAPELSYGEGSSTEVVENYAVPVQTGAEPIVVNGSLSDDGETSPDVSSAGSEGVGAGY
jgi:hypothetical protein